MPGTACRIQTISWKPRAIVYHGFLSEQECRHIINVSHAQVGRLVRNPLACMGAEAGGPVLAMQPCIGNPPTQPSLDGGFMPPGRD